MSTTSIHPTTDDDGAAAGAAQVDGEDTAHRATFPSPR